MIQDLKNTYTMPSTPWVEGFFLERPHRFMVRVETAQGVVEAHCPNSGSLKDVRKVGAHVLLSAVPPHIERKLRYTWEWVKDEGHWVGVHTHHANDWAYHALKAGLVKELGDIRKVQREVIVPDGRIDFLVNGCTYVEVKSVHWRAWPSSTALFPDGVTSRGLKHLKTLQHLVEQGFEAVVLFVVQRNDCDAVAPAWQIDSKFSQALVDLPNHGVRCLAYACQTPDSGQIGLSHPVKILEKANL